MKSKLFYKILHITFFTILLCTVNIRCAKTDDVVPIDNSNDSTGTIDTIYYGFVLNEVLYDPPPKTTTACPGFKIVFAGNS